MEPQKFEYQALSRLQKKLLDAAEAALIHAYNPYSRFSVGAALLTRTGAIIPGANVENAAYGSAICAERAALVSANASGHRKFEAVAIIGRPRDLPDKAQEGGSAMVTAPCGACRQMLFEAYQVSQFDLDVMMATADKSQVVILPITALLPYGFGPDNLGVDIREFERQTH